MCVYTISKQIQSNSYPDLLYMYIMYVHIYYTKFIKSRKAFVVYIVMCFVCICYLMRTKTYKPYMRLRAMPFNSHTFN